MKNHSIRTLLVSAFALSLLVAGLPLALAATPGDDPITINVGDSFAGGDVLLDFEVAYADQTAAGTDIYVYVPLGAVGDDTVDGMDPGWDPNPGDEFDPCPTKFDAGDYFITQDQINTLGDTLRDQIVAVNEAHFGPIGEAVGGDPDSDALVVLAYNVLDDFYYDCDADTYTAGFFAPGFIDDYGMNVIVIDTFDWANRVGDPNPLYEGVIGHELEHLLMNYSDPGELSWVDEGLADMAIFLNGWGDTNGSHVLYHQVFHRETSLTRWGGGLENYGASYTYFLYLWEQAGGNGDGTLEPDLQDDGEGGDLLIKLIFENPADGMDGVQAAIDIFNGLGHPGRATDMPSAEDSFKDWAVAIWLDAEVEGTQFDFENLNFGDAVTRGWTIEVANEIFFGDRGVYTGSMPPARWATNRHVPTQTALPYSVSYETFRNPGPTFGFTLDGEATTVVAPKTGDEHWYGGYESQSDNTLTVEIPITGGEAFDFWSWYFIEDGWDFGYAEAWDGAEWVTIPLFDDGGNEVTTNDDPFGNNEEGNGLTGTSGGAYFVDDPVYVHLNGDIPVGATGLRFRYSTDAAYLDTGWFIDDVSVAGGAVDDGNLGADGWISTTGAQNNHWVIQIVSSCDLTPGVLSPGEIEDAAGHIYRFESDGMIEESGFDTSCMRSTKDRFAVIISNLPTGDLTFLDADYSFGLSNEGNKGGVARGNGKK